MARKTLKVTDIIAMVEQAGVKVESLADRLANFGDIKIAQQTVVEVENTLMNAAGSDKGKLARARYAVRIVKASGNLKAIATQAEKMFGKNAKPRKGTKSAAIAKGIGAIAKGEKFADVMEKAYPVTTTKALEKEKVLALLGKLEESLPVAGFATMVAQVEKIRQKVEG